MSKKLTLELPSSLNDNGSTYSQSVELEPSEVALLSAYASSSIKTRNNMYNTYVDLESLQSKPNYLVVYIMGLIDGYTPLQHNKIKNDLQNL